MLEVKVLSGPQKGQVFRLSKGLHKIGRGSSCEILLNHSEISKEHACIEVYEDRVILSDMNSRNGTFINGVQIKSQILNTRDQISVHDVHLQVRAAALPVSVGEPGGTGATAHTEAPLTDNYAAYDPLTDEPSQGESPPSEQN